MKSTDHLLLCLKKHLVNVMVINWGWGCKKKSQ